MIMRLDKYLSDQTMYTRKDIKKLLCNQQVLVNGKIVREGQLKIDAKADKVQVSGSEIVYRDKIYLLLNKPEGYVCATEDKKDATVLKLVPDNLKRKDLFPAGRLDKDSEGMVLITNDGALSHKLLSPKKHMPKYYMVKLRKKFGDNYEKVFSEGIVIDGGEKCLPANVRVCPGTENMAFIELFEGKFHQVKRMFSAVENNVEKLVRVRIGSLEMPEKLGIGECMELLHNDVENLLKSEPFDEVLNHFFVDFSSYWINKL